MDELRLCLLEERTERGGFYLRYEFYTIEVLLLLSRGGAFNVTTKEDSSEPCGGCEVCILSSFDLACFFPLSSKSLDILNSLTI